MTDAKVKLSSPKLSQFFASNVDFDLVSHDFFDARVRQSLIGEPAQLDETLDILKPYQRLYRMFPDHSRFAALAGDDTTATAAERVAKGLIARGYGSAAAIARVSPRRFERECGDVFGGDEILAGELHHRAIQVAATARHAFANIRGLIASPHDANSIVRYANPAVASYFRSLPSYQSLFGSLDYVEVPHDASIFGAAAYLLDIMRITDEYITFYNEQTIPRGFLLKDRRPDLFNRIKLDGATTTALLPYISLIVQTLEARLANALDSDPYKTLALAPYPFNLPFGRAWSETELYLTKAGTSLAAIGQAMRAPEPNVIDFTRPDLAAAALGLCPEQVAELTTENESDAEIGAQYGIAAASAALPKAGTGQLAFAEDTTTATGVDVDPSTVFVVGQRLETEGQIRTVTQVVSGSGKITVDVPFVTTSAGAAYSVYAFPIDLTAAGSFRTVAGDLLYQDLDALLTQHLSAAEKAQRVGDGFFINATGEELAPLEQVQGNPALGNVVVTLTPLSQKRLDRLSRFIRLTQWTATDAAAADWLIGLDGNGGITSSFLSLLAATKSLADRLKLDLGIAASMVGPFKTIGKGNLRAPIDPFDLVFNKPSLLHGLDPYTAANPIAFDPERPLSWAPGGLQATGVAGTLRGADASSATLAADAPDVDDVLGGFQIAITRGTGAGQSRIIRAYAGTTKTAVLYANWTITPDASSEYLISNATDLADRLAAALSTRATELASLGLYYQTGNPTSGLGMVLDLTTLTGLWRLGQMASANRLLLGEYLVVRRLAGLNGAYAANPAAALTDAQKALEMIDWLRAREMTAYELDYAVNGTPSRYLRPRFQREQTGGILQSLAASTVNLHLTPSILADVGFSAEQADEILRALQPLGIIDSSGLVLPNDVNFLEASAAFPVTVAALVALGLSKAEATAVIDNLASQRPAYLSAATASNWSLTASYMPGQPIDFLCVGLPDASGKQATLGTFFDGIAAQTRSQLSSPTLPFAADTGFQSADIGAPQSRLVFDRLLDVTPTVLIAGASAELAYLSATYQGSTADWNLFTSTATGQAQTIASYAGATRIATTAAAWTTVPDAFACYEIIATIDSGTAQGADADSISLALGASDQNGAFVGDLVAITAGAGQGEQRIVTAYTGATRIATVDRPWTTPPDGTSVYVVERALARGNVKAATSTTVTLADTASNVSGAYDQATIRLVTDPDAAAKTEQVAAILNSRRTEIATLAQAIAQTQAAQCAAVTGACADILALASSQVQVAMTYLDADQRPRRLVPVFLGGDSVASRQTAGDILDGLSRFVLVRSKIALMDAVWTAMARAPAIFSLTFTSPLVLSNLLAAGNLVALARRNGASPESVTTYLQLWSAVVGKEAKLAALEAALGWQSTDTQVLDSYLRASGTAPDQDPEVLAGLVRLDPIFSIISTTSSDGAFMVQVADMVASPPLGTIEGDVSPSLWGRLAAVAAAALSMVAVRYADGDFAGVADELRRAADERKRDALMSYLIWTLGKTIPTITSPPDLFEYLLIDVEQSGADTTSPIAQGITSVQLYMQRCRMGLEPGVIVDHIPEVWWSWMSAYRQWEANRKIFLYPENYLDPATRKSASPEFEQLRSDLLQGRPTETNIAKSFLKYFTDFEKLCSLVPIGACKKAQRELEGSQIDETALLVGRTNTSPYAYYVREFTRSTIPATPTASARQVDDWRPWLAVDVKVDANYVTPVWAFERLFVFWNEVSAIKSSTITSVDGTNSSTQSTWSVTPRFTFQAATGEWLSPQAATDPNPNRLAPNTYAPASVATVQAAYAPDQHYWAQPLALALPRGLPGTGTLTFTKSGRTATGSGTRLDGQIVRGDYIVANGQQLQVESIDAATQTLNLTTAFRSNGNHAPFNVRQKDSMRQRYAPFTGPGLASVVKNFDVVRGNADTRFTVDFMVGDYIEVQGEIRTVDAIADDQEMAVTSNWTTTSQFGAYRIIPREDGAEKLLIFYGPNLDYGTDYGTLPEKPPSTSNPTGDPFVAATNDFNSELYNGINLLNIIKNEPLVPSNGQVTGCRSTILSAALDQRQIRVFAPLYSEAISQTSPLIRAGVDRQNQLLFARTDAKPLVSLYWGNSAPGTTANQLSYTASDRVLLYHISPDTAALIAVNNQIGWSIFNNADDAFLITVSNLAPIDVGNGIVLKTFALTTTPDDPGVGAPPLINKMISFGPYTFDGTSFQNQTYQVERLNTGVAQSLKRRLFGGIDVLLSLDSQLLPETPFDQYYANPGSGPPPALDATHLPPSLMDFSGAYGPYFWEIFYHVPTLVAGWLAANQNYEDAKRWYEYVFNPTATSDPLGATGNTRYWRFRPFRENMDIPSLLSVLTNTFEINLYNNDPFDPHAIARLRISAYAKYAVLRYIDNLIKWADALFTQDTRESIAQATNLYVVARDLLGRKPQVVGVFKQPTPLTYDEIKSHYSEGGIPQFLIDLENTPVVSNNAGGSGYADVPINDIHAYFGVPDNAELAVYWETIDDRLYKIRNGMDINGVRRSLALFAPPINPADVIAGLGVGGELGGSFGAGYPIPNYRFTYLIAVARLLADQVSRLGFGLLGALERRDAEALAQLQLTNEAQLLLLSTEMKQKTIVQVQQQIASLVSARGGAEARFTHFNDLILAGMLPTEIAQEVTLGIAGGLQMASSVLGAAAAVAIALPNIGSPFAMTYGGAQIGASLQNLSGWSAALATGLQTANQILAIEANHSRRVEDWQLQKTLASFDIAQFDAQIAATEQQLEISQRDLQIHQAQIAINQSMQAFQKGKFTNEALYSWMAGKLATSYFQAYGIALEFARMAQRAYQYEYRTGTSFIGISYWDDLRRGLTAGEQLGQALSQLEAAYIRSGSRSQNITKVVSLQQLDPVAFLRFVATGETQFDLPERIFDEDFPGQYRRRIASIQVTLPALVGPYRNIHATLTQTANRVVLQPDLDAVRFLLGDDVEVAAGTIEHNVRAFQKISLSKGQGDSGAFNASPSDPLYLPFEQTGAVSSWRLTMPKPANLISFDTISDVIIEVQYTALDGGDRFAQQVAGLPQLRERQWTALLQPSQQYGADWSGFMNGPVTAERQTLRFTAHRLIPPNISQPEAIGVYVRLEVAEGTFLAAQHPYLSLSIAGSDPVMVLPTPDGLAYAMFERGQPLDPAGAEITAVFNLASGFTPAALRTEDGQRLNPAALRDLQIVPFLSGKA